MKKDKKILTAKEFMEEHLHSVDSQDIESCMIEFAKLHVKNCIAEVVRTAEVVIFNEQMGMVEQNSVYNAYPLSNIK